jgi:hypothetical protein
MDGIVKALLDFAFDPDTGEGSHSAINKAEKWRDSLEEMLEVGNKNEQEACLILLQAVSKCFEKFLG